MRLGRDRRALATAALALVVGSFYFWTALSSPEGGNYYGLLTDGFLDGRASLPVTPAPELLELPNPYDPAQNAPWRLHDASLYDGRYYLYFGPTPVLLVYMPLRLVGVHASENVATATLAFVGFLFALALMRFLIDRYRPRTSLLTLVVAGLMLGLANVAPFLLRRPEVYEVAIAGGYCCLLAGLYLTLAGVLRDRPSLWRLAGGSLALGLAVGARPNLILAIPVWIWAWNRAWRARDPDGRSSWRLASAALGPLGACLVLLAAYNAVRFGSPTEFGSTYQLAGTNMRLYDRFAFDRILPGAFSYLAAPPRLDIVFPFAHLDPRYTGVLPDFYAAGVEPVAGLLVTTPLILAAFAAPAILAGIRGRATRARESMVLATLLLGTALLVTLAPVVSFDAATMRYEVDFATLFLLAALLVWLWLEDNVRPRSARVALRVVAAVSVVGSMAFALAFSVTGYYDGLRAGSPGAYERIKGVFDVVPTLASKLQGEPVVLETRPAPGSPTPESVVQFAAPGAGTAVVRVTPVAGPSLPPGSLVPADIRTPGGRVTRMRMTIGTPELVTVPFGGAGVANVRFRWGTARTVTTAAPSDPVAAGVGVDDVHVVEWSPR